jgi:hypothetical protein
MGKFFDNWAWAHRNARAWGMVIVLVGLLTWALWATRAERIEYRETSGELVEVIGGNQGSLFVGRVRLDDGKEIKLYLPQQLPPKAGDSVPLIMERYDDGSVLYAFDNGKWIADGGGAR